MLIQIVKTQQLYNALEARKKVGSHCIWQTNISVSKGVMKAIFYR